MREVSWTTTVWDDGVHALLDNRSVALVPDDGAVHVVPIGGVDLIVAPAFF